MLPKMSAEHLAQLPQDMPSLERLSHLEGLRYLHMD